MSYLCLNKYNYDWLHLAVLGFEEQADRIVRIVAKKKKMSKRLEQIANQLSPSQDATGQRAPTDPSRLEETQEEEKFRPVNRLTRTIRVDGYVVLITGGAQGG